MRNRSRQFLLLLPLVAVGGLAGPARAQVGGAYNLSWNRISGGGGRSVAGAAYALIGTAGQPEAGSHAGGVYLLQAGFWNRGVTATAVGNPPPSPYPEAGAPIAFRLFPASPNPFVGETRLSFRLPRESATRMSVYDVSGALVRTLVNDALPAGDHQVTWGGVDREGRRVSQGIYLLRLESGPSVATQKVVLAR